MKPLKTIRSRPWRRAAIQKRLQVHCVIRESQLAPERHQSRTARIFEQIATTDAAGGAGGQTSYAALQRADAQWARLRRGECSTPAGPFVKENPTALDSLDYDVIICGGTLGVFLACTLQQRGFRVVVIERGQLRGRQQEWNVSRRELEHLATTGVMTEDEIESCVCGEWERVRAGFHKGHEVWTTGVLNIGISPERLIKHCVERFKQIGGTVLDRSPIESVQIRSNGISVELPAKDSDTDSKRCVNGKLLIDCMGNFSPIVQQIRQGQRPDGVCVVVGTCARGYSQNDYSDLIKTNESVVHNQTSGSRVQYFWEAFPAGTGPTDRTTYMFAYLDATPERPSLEDMFEDYWRRLPAYQNVALEDLEFLRALFGFFPAYRDSPLRPQFNRIIHVGDAGGLQSPLSFGGFGAMLRHLHRHTDAISTALNANILDKDALKLINPYNPGLRCTWLFQSVMCAQQNTPPDLINNVLSSNFKVMEILGPRVITPFLQDVTQFGPLSSTLLLQLITNPGFIVTATRLLGFAALIDWLPHFFCLGGYQLATTLTDSMRQFSTTLPPRDMYKWQRYADAFEFGSGMDYDR